jgi:hypothetical protein
MMIMVKLFADLLRIDKKKIFWISKLLDTEYVEVDKMTMQCVEKEIRVLSDECMTGSRRKWPTVLGKVQPYLSQDVGYFIAKLHLLTERLFSKHPRGVSDMMGVCQKLSNYMMYLLITHPYMLPLNFSAEAVLEGFWDLKDVEAEIPYLARDLQPTEEVVEELVYIWVRFLICAAGKTRPEMHAAELSRGGELVTFVWLIMALKNLGDSQRWRIRFTDANSPDSGRGVTREICAFPVPAAGT